MKIFFLGISGISMSALAVISKKNGHKVFGFDINLNNKILKENGIEVCNELNYDLVDQCDLIVYSSAFSLDFPLLRHAKAVNKKCMCRGEYLALIADQFEKVIAVAGSHGKSSVTAMIYNILQVAGEKPSLHVGAFLKNNEKNFQIAEKKYFVTEACEYFDNFLYLKPYLGAITNIEEDHIDYFKSFENLKRSFKKFENNCEIIVSKTNLKYKIRNIDKLGRLCFDVFENKKKLMRLKLNVLGIYNVQNALIAIEACRQLNIDLWKIKLGLESFYGIEKRCEKVKSILPAKVIVDYAHHPTEIKSLLQTSELLNGKKICVFQPHTYSRTKEFLKDFIDVLTKFDEILLFKTFPAREKEAPEIEEELLSGISKNKDCVLYFDENALIEKLFEYRKDDIIFIVGAGDLPEILQSKKIIWR